jgi:DNA polymerase
VFVGEAPGREEDRQGVPFVGAAGRLLTKMIQAMGMRREEVYICNVLKDRPPENRTPLPEEVEACLPFLREQLAIVKPQVICALGAVATKALLGSPVSLSSVRGRLLRLQTTDYRPQTTDHSPQTHATCFLVPTFHPAYLLRNPSAKRLAWEDLKTVKKLLLSTQHPPQNMADPPRIVAGTAHSTPSS